MNFYYYYQVIADSQREYNGNSDSKTESSTHTIFVMYPLEFGHQVKYVWQTVDLTNIVTRCCNKN